MSIGLNPLGVRDAGLALATAIIFLYGLDRYTLDWRIINSPKGFLGILK